MTGVQTCALPIYPPLLLAPQPLPPLPPPPAPARPTSKRRLDALDVPATSHAEAEALRGFMRLIEISGAQSTSSSPVPTTAPLTHHPPWIDISKKAVTQAFLHLARSGKANLGRTLGILYVALTHPRPNPPFPPLHPQALFGAWNPSNRR